MSFIPSTWFSDDNIKENAKNSIGERIEWSTCEFLFPNRWIVLKDFEVENDCLVAGILEAVLTDEEVKSYKEQLKGTGFGLIRTSGNIITNRVVNEE